LFVFSLFLRLILFVRSGLQAMKDLSAFFKEKAKIDEAYAAQIKVYFVDCFENL
jgi:hypothetical protein